MPEIGRAILRGGLHVVWIGKRLLIQHESSLVFKDGSLLGSGRFSGRAFGNLIGSGLVAICKPGPCNLEAATNSHHFLVAPVTVRWSVKRLVGDQVNYPAKVEFVDQTIVEVLTRGDRPVQIDFSYAGSGLLVLELTTGDSGIGLDEFEELFQRLVTV